MNEENITNLANNLNMDAVAPIFGNNDTEVSTSSVIINTEANTGISVDNTVISIVDNHIDAVQSSVIPTPIATNTETNVVETSAEKKNETPTDLNEEAKPSHTEPVEIEGDVEIPVGLIKDMLTTIRKVGTANNLQPGSEVMNLIVNENGLTMRATNGSEDIEMTDRSFVFKNNSILASLDIKVFGDFISSLNCYKVTLYYDEATKVLTVKTDTGTFKFAQKIDISTNLPIVHELKFKSSYNNMKALNYNTLLQVLDTSKSVRAMASKMGYDFLKGTHFSNIVASSDGIIMLLQENIEGFNTNEFFLNMEYCNLIGSIRFEEMKFKVDFVKNDSGELKGLVVSDGRITLCGPVSTQTDFPVDVCKHFWDSNEFIHTIQVNAKAFSHIVKSVIPFINSNFDGDKIAISINGNMAKIVSMNGSAEQTIPVINVNNYTTPTSLLVPATKISSILQTMKSETLEILIDPNSNNCICLKYDEYKCIVSLLND